MVLLKSKSVFDTRLERGRLHHGDDVLDSSLRRNVDEIPTTTLAIPHITGLKHEDADACVWFSDVKADVSFTSAKASSNETGLLPNESSATFALMMSSVRSEKPKT